MKHVYFFSNGNAEGDSAKKELLGGKGAGLTEMTNLGIPVPPGFIISTEACLLYYKNNEKIPEEIWSEILSHLSKLEDSLGKKFGDVNDPLLVSVRSGARVSMPGMMDTVLNLGLNDQTVKGIAKIADNERFAYDSYRRFIQMFGDVVLGIEHHKFEKILNHIKNGRKLDTDLTTEDLKNLVQHFEELVKKETGQPFPQHPIEQLKLSINAVFDSWHTNRATTYRKIHKIPDNWGTAVNVQAMVFGNMGETSGTGVAFTRNPSTGERLFFGEFLMNAQGEDVVAGIRTPEPISKLKEIMPEAYNHLEQVYQKLETHYKDMQDIEFTIENEKLYMLQTRTGKRTASSAVKIAYDMVKEGLIDKKTALMRISPEQVDQLLHPTISPHEKYKVIARGLPASPGAAVGKVVFTAKDAEEWVERGEKVILVRNETSPEDIGGMNVAEGILTATGGMTSHAAVVARGMGKCCVAGCSDLDINEKTKKLAVADIVIKEGTFVSINGTTGEFIQDKVKLVKPTLSYEFSKILEWTSEIKTLGVRTNADTPKDAKVAREFGAEGIGLCRTEHMFFEGTRIDAVREMILSESKADRKKALAKIKPFQKDDFKNIFQAMEGLPVTIRLLDPPLHEFLPHTEDEIRKVAQLSGVSYEKLKAKTEALKEFNPMLGHRGCRIGISFPEVYEMQSSAIMEAACECHHDGITVKPEIMIPLVGFGKELDILRALVKTTAEETMDSYSIKIDFLIGTMIELPRAAITADEIAKFADFFSFGTNDLTQTSLGLSRDDSGKFLPHYIERGIFKEDPFTTIDIDGVGALVVMGVKKGKEGNPNLKTGICGEHGGDPASISFCQKAGLNYVSCSPYRVPIAKLAAAQAKINE